MLGKHENMSLVLEHQIRARNMPVRLAPGGRDRRIPKAG